MKKNFIFYMFLISLLMLIFSTILNAAEVKTNNISTILPNKINLNSFSKSEKIEKNENGVILLKEKSKLTYDIKVKKSGIYKVMLKITGNRNSDLSLSENVVPDYVSKYSLNFSIYDEELIEFVTYLDKNSTKLNISLERGEINLSDILISYSNDGGIIGMEGSYSLTDKNLNLLNENLLTFIPVGKGFYKIITMDGSLIIQENNDGKLEKAPWVNDDNQIWKLFKDKNSNFMITNKNSEKAITKGSKGLVLDENKELKTQYFSLKKEKTIDFNNENKEWKLVWNDEFEVNGLPDPKKWSFDVRGPGWVNDELQAYTDTRLENCRIENGKLIIEARKDGNDYTSARIKTEGKGDWLYGKVVVRAKIPKGRGVWPAIWMMPTDNKYGSWPNSGEIDTMEYVGHEPGLIHASMHSKDKNFMNGQMRTNSKYIPNVEEDFHDYILDWNEKGITILVDDIVIGSWKTDNSESWESWPWNNRFHLIINIAMGGSWGGQQGVDDSIWPQKMEVDYVRVYQK